MRDLGWEGSMVMVMVSSNEQWAVSYGGGYGRECWAWVMDCDAAVCDASWWREAEIQIPSKKAIEPSA